MVFSFCHRVFYSTLYCCDLNTLRPRLQIDFVFLLSHSDYQTTGCFFHKPRLPHTVPTSNPRFLPREATRTPEAGPTCQRPREIRVQGPTSASPI